MTEDIRFGQPPQAPAPVPAGAPKTSKRRFVIALIAVAALFAGAGTIAYGILVPATITVSGELELTHDQTAKASCIGQGGYADIHNGAQVIVTDATGRTLALGRLAAGQLASGLDVCRYQFTVDDVPAGYDFYGIEVSHRGRVQFTRDNLDKPIHLTLG